MNSLLNPYGWQANMSYPNNYPNPATGYMNQSLPNPTPIVSTRPVSNLTGRMVSNENEITPNEVPMDGSLGLFPTSDGNFIFVKQWQSDGTIKTIRFVPEKPIVEIEQVKQDNAIIERLDKIEKLLSNTKRKEAQT